MMHRLKNLPQLGTIYQARRAATRAIDGDKDVFGTLSNYGRQSLAVSSAEKFISDDPDGYDKEEFTLEARKNEFYYKYEITKYARQGRIGIRRALQLFERMKSQDRISPTVQNFSALIYGCAKAGFTKKAFELYEESLKYTDKPTRSTVTCLFNACAESPFAEYGVKRLEWFIDHLKFNHNYTLNKIQYHSAIKAYGKLGKLEEVSKLIKEMIDNSLYPDTSTFDMLLVGCASDTRSGAILALRLFKRMKLYGIKPSTTTYRLLLRCIRDCGIGSEELVRRTLGELPAMTSLDQKLIYKKLNRVQPADRFEDFEWAPLLSDLASSVDIALDSLPSNEITKNRLRDGDEKASIAGENYQLNSIQQGYYLQTSSSKNPPNLLSGDHLDLTAKIEHIQVDKLKSGVDRLLLFGGLHGYLEQMVKDECTPDSKTFSLILQCIRPSRSRILEYFRLTKDYSIKRDLLFYDLLIRHICQSFYDKTRLQHALCYLDEMHLDGIRPNISTFESLALGCDSTKDAKRLIDDVVRAGFVPSDVMIARMFQSAIQKTDLKFMVGLLNICRRTRFRPTKRLVDELEQKRIEIHDLLVREERGLLEEGELPVWWNEHQADLFDSFSKILGSWLKDVEIIMEDHPWRQFNVKKVYKKEGLHEFVQDFKTLIKVKEDALKKGGNLGNLFERASQVGKQRE